MEDSVEEAADDVVILGQHGVFPFGQPRQLPADFLPLARLVPLGLPHGLGLPLALVALVLQRLHLSCGGGRLLPQTGGLFL